jgi:hypothetical protein
MTTTAATFAEAPHQRGQAETRQGLVQWRQMRSIEVWRTAELGGVAAPAMTSAFVDQKAVSLVESNMTGRYRPRHRLGSHECDSSCGGAFSRDRPRIVPEAANPAEPAVRECGVPAPWADQVGQSQALACNSMAPTFRRSVVTENGWLIPTGRARRATSWRSAMLWEASGNWTVIDSLPVRRRW